VILPGRSNRPSLPDHRLTYDLSDRPLVPRSGVTVVEPVTSTVREVAKLLGISLGGTYALVRDGTIPATRLGGRWLIPRARFHDWLDAVSDQRRADGSDLRRRR
jgi:excisionase family DNA binding protein